MKRALLILVSSLFALSSFAGDIPDGYHLTNHGRSIQDNDGVITYPISEAPRLLAIQRRARGEGATVDSAGGIHHPPHWIYMAPMPYRVWVIRTDDGVLYYFRDELDRLDRETNTYQFRLPNGHWINVGQAGVGSIGG